MNKKSVFKQLLLLVTALFVLGNISLAQVRTFYVDNQIGSDGYDGLSQSVTLPSTGPKVTITNALAAANSGDIVLVKNTGVTYVESILIQDGGTKKLLTIGSYGGGTPIVNGTLTLNNTAAAAADKILTINGPIQFSTGLTLTSGSIVGASNLTIGGTVTRVAGSVDTQISVTGTVNYVYTNGANMVTGNELPASATIGTLTTNGGFKVTLDRNVSMSSTLTVGAGNLDLGAFTLSTNSTIAAGANNIVNGTIAATANGQTFTANDLPVITAAKSSAGLATLTIVANSTLGLTASTNASITATLSGGTGATVLLGSVRGSVLNTGAGTILLDRSAGATLWVAGNVTLSGTGAININGANATAYNVSGNVTLSSAISISANGQAAITFGAVPTTIGGTVSNSAVITGTIATATTFTTNAVITLGAADALVSIGAISNTADMSGLTLTTAASSLLTTSGNILFGWTGATLANTFTVGTVTNSAKFSGSNAGNVNNGKIQFTAVSAAAASTITTGAITNSTTLVSGAPATGGLIDFGILGSAAITAASVSSTGGYGGDIQFGIGNVTVTGAMSNDRSQTGADILFGAGTAGKTFTAGSVSNTGKSIIAVTSLTTGNLSVTGGVTVSGTATFSAANMAGGNVGFGTLTVLGGTVTMTGAGTVTIGSTSVSGGTVTLPTGAASFGNLTLSGTGTLDLSTGNPTTAIAVANFNVTAGTLNLGTGARTLTVSGTANSIGAAGNPTFTGGAATTLVIGTPNPIGQITFTMGTANPIWPGLLTVNNTSAGSVFPIGVVFTGGNLLLTNASGLVYFQAGVVQLNGTKLYIASSTGTNDFQNVAGYQTINNGYVSIANNAGNPQVSGAGVFGDFEVNSSAGVVSFAAATGKFVGNFYLTNGSVNGTNLVFNNPAPAYPTIIRNAGLFTVAPSTFASRVNVTYIGTDKAAGLEVPVDSLFNLTVATTNTAAHAASNVYGGGVATRGVVTITSGTVNGALTVNAGQVLALANGASLTLNGATAQIDGDVVNLASGGVPPANTLVLGAAAGTTINGAGLLPPINVAVGSVGNVINGSRGLADVQLGADFTIGGGNDVITATTSVSNANLMFGAGNGSVTAIFSAVTGIGTHVANITTVNAGNTLTLGANLVVNDKLTHAAGVINLGAFTLKLYGNLTGSQDFTGGAQVIGTGTLSFVPGIANTLNVFTSADTIAANVSVNGAAALLTLAAANNDLVLNGTLTVTGGANGISIGAGRTLTARNNVTMGTGTAFSGTGILKLDGITPINFSYAGTPTIVNLTINNDVNLGGSGSSLTVSGAFVHSGGVLNFFDRDLTVSGTYVRSGSASYLAGAGFFIYSGTSFNQGTTALALPNLRLSNGAQTIGNTGVVTVNNILDVNLAGTFTITKSGGVRLAVASGAVVNVSTANGFDVAPLYQGPVTLNATLNGTIAATVWPASLVVTTFKVALIGAGSVGLPANRTVTNTVNLFDGVLSAAFVTTIADSGTIRRTENGSATAGAFAFGNAISVVYEPSTASAGGDITTGTELPAAVQNLTVTRSANVGNAILTLNAPLVVSGTLTIKNNFIATGVNTITANGNVTIGLDAYASATNPTTTFTAPLTFGGAATQTFALNGNRTITNLTMSKTNSALVNVTGGNLTIGTMLTLVSGVLSIADPYAVILTQTLTGQGFDHTGVVYPAVSHVAGKVRQAVASGQGMAGTNGRYEFPIGSATKYRPMAITFTPSYPANNPTNIEAKVVDTTAGGVAGLPVTDDVGIKIGGYPNYYWLVNTTPSSFTSTQKFDIELQGTNLGYAFSRTEDLRIIRRQDGNAASNPWSIQGLGSTYTDNYVRVDGLSDSVLFVRASSSTGGIVNAGTRFTIGIPTRPPAFTSVNPDTSVNEGDSLKYTFVAASQNIGAATITYGLVAPLVPNTSINPTTGAFVFKPDYTQAGSVVITVSAYDGQFTATKVLNVTVINVNRRPTITAKLAATATVRNGDTLSFQYLATDPDAGNTITFSVTGAPAGMTITAAGKLSWIPTFLQVGLNPTIKVFATDNLGGKDSATTAITVTRSNVKGDINGDGVVGTTDATLALQHAAGLAGFILTDTVKLWAGDVTGNGLVTAYDASWILRKVAGDPNVIFAPKAAVGTGSMSLGKAQSSDANVLTIPVKIADAQNVTSAQFTVTFDAANATYEGVKTTLPKDWVVMTNKSEGKVTVAMAGVTPVASSEIAVIALRMKNPEAKVTVTGQGTVNELDSQTLTLENVRLMPTEYALDQNYPNPFNPSTTIKYQLTEDSKVNLTVYNLQGQAVRTLVNDNVAAGFQSITWNGRNDMGQTVATGMYIYRIQAGSFVSVKKMLMLK